MTTRHNREARPAPDLVDRKLVAEPQPAVGGKHHLHADRRRPLYVAVVLVTFSRIMGLLTSASTVRPNVWSDASATLCYEDGRPLVAAGFIAGLRASHGGAALLRASRGLLTFLTYRFESYAYRGGSVGAATATVVATSASTLIQVGSPAEVEPEGRIRRVCGTPLNAADPIPPRSAPCSSIVQNRFASPGSIGEIRTARGAKRAIACDQAACASPLPEHPEQLRTHVLDAAPSIC